MGWITKGFTDEPVCYTPNGEHITHMEEVDGMLWVVTPSQVYKMVVSDKGAQLLEVHRFMQPGRA